MTRQLYVWACSVCRDPNYRREPGPGTYQYDERWCPSCNRRQPVISYHIEDVCPQPDGSLCGGCHDCLINAAHDAQVVAP